MYETTTLLGALDVIDVKKDLFIGYYSIFLIFYSCFSQSTPPREQKGTENAAEFIFCPVSKDADKYFGICIVK